MSLVIKVIADVTKPVKDHGASLKNHFCSSFLILFSHSNFLLLSLVFIYLFIYYFAAFVEMFNHCTKAMAFHNVSSKILAEATGFPGLNRFFFLGTMCCWFFYAVLLF